MTRGTGRSHFARAALEAMAYQSADVVDLMERDSGQELVELRVDGGAASNDLLCQFQADVLDVPVLRPAVTETTVLGAAFLAGPRCGRLGLDRRAARRLAAGPAVRARHVGRDRANVCDVAGRRRSNAPRAGPGSRRKRDDTRRGTAGHATGRGRSSQLRGIGPAGGGESTTSAPCSAWSATPCAEVRRGHRRRAHRRTRRRHAAHGCMPPPSASPPGPSLGGGGARHSRRSTGRWPTA